ncbi:MAG: hypothetical protein QOD30_192 [Actinomycetota bacterium]|nr:hypothetical protein [Actinomycetota bacterium]
MAIYVPESRRRRTLIVVAVVCAVAGLVLGVVAGRASSPSLADRVHDVQEQAREATSQLRVVALHEDASTGTEGNDLALKRAHDELAAALDDATWISAADGRAVLASVDALQGDSSASAIEGVAKKIDAAFGIKD